MMDILKQVTEFAQENDPNGTHFEVIKDIENGSVQYEEIKEYYINLLTEWSIDVDGKNDYITVLINLLRD